MPAYDPSLPPGYEPEPWEYEEAEQEARDRTEEKLDGHVDALSCSQLAGVIEAALDQSWHDAKQIEICGKLAVDLAALMRTKDDSPGLPDLLAHTREVARDLVREYERDNCKSVDVEDVLREKQDEIDARGVWEYDRAVDARLDYELGREP